eukprot:COSAG06_NODE_2656_length_6487_cov_109.872260_5_plen_107_part_00
MLTTCNWRRRWRWLYVYSANDSSSSRRSRSKRRRRSGRENYRACSCRGQFSHVQLLSAAAAEWVSRGGVSLRRRWRRSGRRDRGFQFTLPSQQQQADAVVAGERRP